MDKRNISMATAMPPTKGLFDDFQSDPFAQDSHHLRVTSREQHRKLTLWFLTG